MQQLFLVGLKIILIFLFVFFKSATKNLIWKSKTHLHFQQFLATDCFRNTGIKMFSNWNGKSANKNVSGSEDGAKSRVPQVHGRQEDSEAPQDRECEQFVEYFRNHILLLPVLCSLHPAVYIPRVRERNLFFQKVTQELQNSEWAEFW